MPTRHDDHPTSKVTGQLILGDCLQMMDSLPEASLDLIYIDPPFCSQRHHSAPDRDPAHPAVERSFGDQWSDGLPEYLRWLGDRLQVMRRLLKPSGSIYVHLDWHACHYVKVEMDTLFGRRNFLNHIVWLYGLGGSSHRHWPRKHDDILWYAKQAGDHYFVAPKVPATSHRMKGQTKKAPDYWDIPTLNNMAKERLGYPTQKPERLLARIVESSCPPGGVVADFFCGSGTTCAVAKRLGRHWIGCDESEAAIAMARRRLDTIHVLPELLA